MAQPIARIIALINAFARYPDKGARGAFYVYCVSKLGTDVTPEDYVSDEFACAETINRLHRGCFKFDIGGGSSTMLLYRALEGSKWFKRTYDALEGDVVISPTGFGNGNI